MKRPPRPNITTEWEFIDPTSAAEYLKRRHPEQRKISQLAVAMYQNDLERDAWVPTHEGIALDVDGLLVDGQTRLSAIIKAGVGTWLIVARNLPIKALGQLGRQRPRSPVDMLRMGGNGTFSRTIVSTALAFPDAPGFQGKKLSQAQLVEVLENEGYLASITWACTATTGVDGSTRSSRVCLARAHFSGVVPVDRLEAFGRVLRTGVAEGPSDSGAVVYRDYLRKMQGMGGYDAERTRYSKGQAAIMAFAEGKTISKLYEMDGDVFPLSR